MRSHAGLLRLALAFAALLLSLSLVVWRQSRALELLRDLEDARMQRAVAEAARSELNRRINHLESRARVVKDAARLGLRVPSTDEMVILPLVEATTEGRRRIAATLRARTGGTR